MTGRIIKTTTRRRFLATTAAAAAFSTVGGIARPFISRAADRPLITHGLQSGDIDTGSGVVWASGCLNDASSHGSLRWVGSGTVFAAADTSSTVT